MNYAVSIYTLLRLIKIDNNFRFSPSKFSQREGEFFIE